MCFTANGCSKEKKYAIAVNIFWVYYKEFTFLDCTAQPLNIPAVPKKMWIIGATLGPAVLITLVMLSVFIYR